MSHEYEKLGAFYLGRRHGGAGGATTAEPILYDSRDLTTHAVIVGMTGSGKTGLGVVLLEEAAIDGLPAIVIDPKGDLGNLLLTFPELRPEDFRPWIDEDEARRLGRSPEEHASAVATAWRDGLAGWDQDGQRIRRLRDAADFALWTPGSSAGLALSALRSFDPPPPALRGDSEAMRERLLATTSGVLGLAGVEGDPLTSREHVLVATLLESAWREGRALDLAGIVRGVRAPPFQAVGVLDLESFFPQAAREQLAARLNNLLASPGFAGWREGAGLDIARLLHAPDGRPRISILSLSHLGDAERMVFVTLLLSEIVAWVRAQPGTSSLRALLYFDEVFGYLPPVAEPPSKRPLLTLLKQARAHGLGCVLATQNPVDLDYKALTNAGTWMVGRLQAERDVDRVVEALVATSRAWRTEGDAFTDRGAITRSIASLPKRVFLMHCVHDEAPVLFETRWAMSYLAGPLTRPQVERLTAQQRVAAVPDAPAAAPAGETRPSPAGATAPERPFVPASLGEVFLPLARAQGAGDRLEYRPGLLALARTHHVKAPLGVDAWLDVAWLLPLPATGEPALAWEEAESLPAPPELLEGPEASASYAPVAPAAVADAALAAARRALASELHRAQRLAVLRSPEHRTVSRADESEADFRARLALLEREKRDAAVEKLRATHAPKLARLQERIRAAQERADREAGQYGHQRLSAAVAVGTTILGALFGRKALSAGTVGRAGTAVRGAARTAREREDVVRAEDRVEDLRAELARLEESLAADIDRLDDPVDASAFVLEEIEIPARKSDIEIVRLALAWQPRLVSDAG